MNALDRKLFRDIAKMKGQMFAVGIIMACGLAMMITVRSVILSLRNTQQTYYSDYRFADLFCDLKRAPNAVRTRLAAIPGIAAVETRVMSSLRIDLPGMVEPADGVVVSIPHDRPLRLNGIYLRTGRFPEVGKGNEVVVSESFAKVHGFQPGDELDVILRGANERLVIVGIGLSPEFLFETRPGEFLPDDRRYGTFWMSERELALACDLSGAFNNVVATLAPGANPTAVLAEIDRVLEPYGGLLAYDRSDHASARKLSDEIEILRGIAVAFPIVFLSIATFMTSAVLARLVRLQREQIAQLKAFGYTNWQVGFHYLKFALVIVIFGLIVGMVIGALLGSTAVKLYHRFFRFPVLEFSFDSTAFLFAVIVSSGATLLGVAGVVRQAMRLPPAEAMRPEPPAEFKPSQLERLGLTRWIGPSMSMAIRNLERRPWQAVFTLLGLSLATAIPIVPGAMEDGIDYLLDFQWSQARRQDATLGLIEPGSAATLHAIRQLPGVMVAEPFRNVPVRFRAGHRSYRLAISGVPPVTHLNRPMDANSYPLPIPSDGLLISKKLAEVLGVKPGDRLYTEIQEGRRPRFELPIVGLISDYSGLAAYMEIGALRRLMKEGDSINGAYVAVDPALWRTFLKELKETPRIATVSINAAVQQTFRKTVAESISLMRNIYFIFSVIVSCGVVYNSARIALSERSRDLATLRVIGFSNREVSAVLIGELALLTLVALPIGFLIGGQLAHLIVSSASTETVRIPLILSYKSYAMAAGIVVASAGFSFYVVSRRLRNLDLLSVLKARD